MHWRCASLLCFAHHDMLEMRYDLACDAHEMYNYALDSFGIYMLVDGFLFIKMLYDPLL
jgi:hypothetical protein